MCVTAILIRQDPGTWERDLTLALEQSTLPIGGSQVALCAHTSLQVPVMVLGDGYTSVEQSRASGYGCGHLRLQRERTYCILSWLPFLKLLSFKRADVFPPALRDSSEGQVGCGFDYCALCTSCSATLGQPMQFQWVLVCELWWAGASCKFLDWKTASWGS